MTIEINGSEFAVEGKLSSGAVWLVGKRGGRHSLVRNVHSGRWVFLRNGTRAENIASMVGL